MHSLKKILLITIMALNVHTYNYGSFIQRSRPATQNLAAATTLLMNSTAQSTTLPVFSNFSSYRQPTAPKYPMYQAHNFKTAPRSLLPSRSSLPTNIQIPNFTTSADIPTDSSASLSPAPQKYNSLSSTPASKPIFGSMFSLTPPSNTLSQQRSFATSANTTHKKPLKPKYLIYCESRRDAINFFTQEIEHAHLDIQAEQIPDIIDTINLKLKYNMLSKIVDDARNLKISSPTKSDKEIVDQLVKLINTQGQEIPSDTDRKDFFQEFSNNEIDDIATFIASTKGLSYQQLEKIGFMAQQISLDQGWKKIDPYSFFSAIDKETSDIFSIEDKTSLLKDLLHDKSRDINIPLIAHLTVNFSRKKIFDCITLATKFAHNNPLNMSYIRQAILDIQYGDKQPMRNRSEKYRHDMTSSTYYKDGVSHSCAIHEACHAFAEHNNSTPTFVSTLTIEPRNTSLGFMQPALTYKGILATEQINLNNIITYLAGTVGEQIFNTYEPQGYSQKMLIDNDEIYTFLSTRIGASGSEDADFEKAVAIASYVVCNKNTSESKDKQNDMIKDIIADCYKEAYKLIDTNKPAIEKLAQATLKKGTLHEDDIAEVLETPRLLHSFEQGPLTLSHAQKFGTYRYPQSTSQSQVEPTTPPKYVYDSNGNDVGEEEGIYDEHGRLQEFD